MVALMIGFIFAKTEQINNNCIIVGLLGLFLPIVTAFPTVLGYGNGTFPDRCRFMVDISIIFSSVNAMFIIGNCVRRAIKNIMLIKLLGMVLVLGYVLLFSTDNFRIWNSMFLKHWDALINGTYKEYQIACENFYNSLENREGEDVVIREADVPKKAPNFGTFELYSDVNHFLNYGISQCYGLSSICVIVEESLIE